MLQATMDVEFLEYVLNDYATSTSISIRTIYECIERNVDTDMSTKIHSGNMVKEMMNDVKTILEECKKTTWAQFLCFKKSQELKLKL